MNGRRAVVGLCMLCALLVSAFAAQSASAATNGTTAFTCKDTGTPAANQFTAAHCKSEDAGTGKYSHVAIAQDQTTEITGSDTNTDGSTHSGAILKATIGGTAIELSASTVHGEGWMTNGLDASGEHFTHGAGTITYTGVTEKKAGCTVSTDNTDKSMGEAGVVHTEPLVATTKGQGDFLKFTPETGTTFARFHLSGCTPSGINGTYTVIGSVKCPVNGATTTCDHATVTGEKTLRLNSAIGPIAGIAGFLTIGGRVDNSGSAYTPLSATTVPTA